MFLLKMKFIENKKIYSIFLIFSFFLVFFKISITILIHYMSQKILNIGADGRTRTGTALATAPSRQRVYQFHHIGQKVYNFFILILRFWRNDWRHTLNWSLHVALFIWDFLSRYIISFYNNTFKQKTAYEILRCLVGSEMCIRDRL